MLLQLTHTLEFKLLDQPSNDLGSKSSLWGEAYATEDKFAKEVGCKYCSEKVHTRVCSQHYPALAPAFTLQIPRATKTSVLPLWHHVKQKHASNYDQLWPQEQKVIQGSTKKPQQQTTIPLTAPTTLQIPTKRAHDTEIFEACCRWIITNHISLEVVEDPDFRALLRKCGYAMHE